MLDPARIRRLEDMQAHKAPRRMQLAEDVSILWESAATVDHQLAEMLAMETDAESQAEIRAGYADLRPTPQRWTASVSIEVRDPGRIKERLAHWAGLEHSFSVECNGRRIPARILGDHGTPVATTAMTYLQFDIPDDPPYVGAKLIVDHPWLQITTLLPPAVTDRES